MRLLVTGGRNYQDKDHTFRVLDCIHQEKGIELVIHGDATGADALAKAWAEQNGIPQIAYPADWKTHGRAAGPIRNRQMLTHQPDLVYAFPGGRGTADMVRAAKAAGVRVIHDQPTPQ